MTLHTRYRPKTFDRVVGQDAVVASIKSLLERKDNHAYVFTGPSGTGKTTLARIIAKAVGCSKNNLMEVNAANFSGADSMREVTENLHLSGLGESQTKFVIIDEAHALSKAAWQVLLKPVEEPPEHVYWAFCTTEPMKIPETIRTRCAEYELKPVEAEDIFNLLTDVVAQEKLKVKEEVLSLIADKCDGSPRRALTWLSKCAGCKDRKAAAEIVRVASDSEDGDVIKLCRGLIAGQLDWKQAMGHVEGLKDQNPESIRIIITNYFTKATMGAKSPEQAQRLLAVLEAFREPYPAQSGISPLLLSLGALLCV